MVPLISLSVIMDSLHGTLSGWPFFSWILCFHEVNGGWMNYAMECNSYPL
jgi:hypothetical protein